MHNPLKKNFYVDLLNSFFSFLLKTKFRVLNSLLRGLCSKIFTVLFVLTTNVVLWGVVINIGVLAELRTISFVSCCIVFLFLCGYVAAWRWQDITRTHFEHSYSLTRAGFLGKHQKKYVLLFTWCLSANQTIKMNRILLLFKDTSSTVTWGYIHYRKAIFLQTVYSVDWNAVQQQDFQSQFVSPPTHKCNRSM